MEVLLWLVPAGLATLLAMGWATWTGHRARRDAEVERRSSPRDDEAARARLGAALAKPVPGADRSAVVPPPDRVGGVAIRRSRAAVGTGAQPGPPTE